MFVFSVLAEYSIILTITGKIRKRKLREERVMNSLQNIFTEILIAWHKYSINYDSQSTSN